MSEFSAMVGTNTDQLTRLGTDIQNERFLIISLIASLLALKRTIITAFVLLLIPAGFAYAQTADNLSPDDEMTKFRNDVLHNWDDNDALIPSQEKRDFWEDIEVNLIEDIYEGEPLRIIIDEDHENDREEIINTIARLYPGADITVDFGSIIPDPTIQDSSILNVSNQDKALLLGGFAIAILAVFLFLARDVILRKKTSYDKKSMESKKEKTFEKYHSDWGDDYEEIGNRRNTIQDKEFREAARDGELPDYYKILKVKPDATQDEIKDSFRELAKKTHPDKTSEDSEKEMAELNRAYEILSDKDSKDRYDRYR